MCNVLASAIFLTQFKDLLENDCVRFDARNQKTSEFMRKFCLSVTDVKEILEELRPFEVFEGPSVDHNGSPGDITLYIKLKVIMQQNGKTGAILSVHEEGIYE